MTLESICRGIESKNKGVTRKEISKALTFYGIMVISAVFLMAGIVMIVTDNILIRIVVDFLTILLGLFTLNYIAEEEGIFYKFYKICKFWWLFIIVAIGIYFLAQYLL